MWKVTTRNDRDRRIYEEELAPWLPLRILDSHVHVFGPGVIPGNGTFSCAGNRIGWYDYDELERDLRVVYPGRDVGAVCFGFPHPAYDRVLNNEYLAERCDRRRFFPLRLFDPQKDTPADLEADLSQKRFYGLKPYPDYARASEPGNVEIRDMLPDWAMEVVDSCALAVVLHLPRPGRLADEINQRQIVELSRRYPRSRIILAHVGRAYFLRNLSRGLEAVRDLPNVFFDLAMVSNGEVLELLFREVEGRRILYGTDIPIALAPGKAVEINDQYSYVTPVPWELSISDDHGRLVFTSFLYEGLRAIKKAAERVGLPREWLEGLFFTNALTAFGVEWPGFERKHP